MSRKCAWMWCKTRWQAATRMPRHVHNAWHCESGTCLLTLNWYIARQLHISLGAEHGVVHDQLDYRKLQARCVLKAHSWSYGTIIHLTRNANQEKQFILCTVTGEETWVNDAKPETKQAFMTCQHQSSLQTKKFKPPSVMRIMGNGFGTLKLCFLPMSLNVVTEKPTSVTLERLRHAIRDQKPVFAARCHHSA